MKNLTSISIIILSVSLIVASYSNYQATKSQFRINKSLYQIDSLQNISIDMLYKSDSTLNYKITNICNQNHNNN